MIDRVLADPAFPKFIAALGSPFLLWATIAMAARRRPELLPRIYPTVKVVTWGFWLFLIVWGMYGISVQSGHFFLATAAIWPLYGGTNLMYQWMRRRVDPAANQPNATEGWWPTPKDKAF